MWTPAGSRNPAPSPAREPARPSRTFSAPGPRSRTGCAQGPPVSETPVGQARRMLRAPGPPLPTDVGRRCQGDGAGHAGKSGEAAQPLSPGGSVLGLQGRGEGSRPRRSSFPNWAAATSQRPSQPSATSRRSACPEQCGRLASEPGVTSPGTSCSRCQVRGFRSQRCWAPEGFCCGRWAWGWGDGADGLCCWSLWRVGRGPGGAA